MEVTRYYQITTAPAERTVIQRAVKAASAGYQADAAELLAGQPVTRVQVEHVRIAVCAYAKDTYRSSDTTEWPARVRMTEAGLRAAIRS